jgi:hypothetical protein
MLSKKKINIEEKSFSFSESVSNVLGAVLFWFNLRISIESSSSYGDKSEECCWNSQSK